MGGILLVGGLYSVLWGKNKESKAVPHGQVNIGCAQDEEEHEKPNKYKVEEAASASTGEQV